MKRCDSAWFSAICMALIFSARVAVAACVSGPDSDGDGVFDACDQCSNTIAGAVVGMDGCPPSIPSDFDRDGDVDPDDLTQMRSCSSRSGIPASSTPTCLDADFDFDIDVDMDDFGGFQRCYSGANVPANPNCVSPSAGIVNGCLRVNGTTASAQLALRLKPGVPTMLEVDLGDNGAADFTFDRAQFTCIVVNAGGGNDEVRIDEVNGVFTNTELTTINGGNGNDNLIGGTGPETLKGGGGADIVQANQGADIVFLGEGNDTFAWNPGDGNDVVEGEAGSDVLIVNGSNAAEGVMLSAVGARLRFFRNIDNATLDVNGVDQVDFQALGGPDSIVINSLANTAVTQVNIDVAATPGTLTGDGQADVIAVNGTPAAQAIIITGNSGAAEVSGLGALVRVKAGEAALDRLAITGVGGDILFVDGSASADTMSVTPSGIPGTARVVSSTFSIPVDVKSVTALVLSGLGGPDLITGSGDLASLGIPLQFDGGEGDDQLIGGTSAEVLLGGLGNDIIVGNQGEDIVFLGDGDDTFTWNPGDGNDLIEGETGADKLVFKGSSADEVIDLFNVAPRLLLQDNVGSVALDIDGVERLDIQALAGVDFVSMNSLVGTSATQVNVDLASSLGGNTGDAQSDLVTINGTPGADTIGFSADSGAVVISGLSAEVRVKGYEVTDVIALSGTGGDFVSVNGSAGPDTMTVTANGTQVRVDVSALSAALGFSGAMSLSINGLGGTDMISCTGNLLGLGIPLQLDGGADNDTILGSNGNDTILGGPGNDFIDGNQGSDTAYGGDDNDTFQWDPGDGNDTLEGQFGLDVLIFNGSAGAENFTLSANGPRLQFLRNLGNVTLDVDGVEQVDLRALGGVDNAVVNSLAGTALTQVNIDLAGTIGGVTGDAAADGVTINGTPAADIFNVSADSGAVIVNGLGPEVRVKGYEGTDQVFVTGVGGDVVNVNGTAGPDTMTLTLNGTTGRVDGAGITAGVNVSGALSLNINGLGGTDMISCTGNLMSLGIPIQLDGGADNDTILGSNANDTILGGPGNNFIDGNQGNDTAYGGDDNDTFQWDPGDGNDTLEGQLGQDVLSFNGSAGSENFTLSANGPRLQFLRNLGNVTLDVDGVDQVDLRALAGTDNAVVNSLAGTAVTQLNIDLAGTIGGGSGDGAVDTITVNGTAAPDTINIAANAGAVDVTGLSTSVHITHPEPANDSLIVNGLDGVDTITPGPGVSALIMLTINQ